MRDHRGKERGPHAPIDEADNRLEATAFEIDSVALGLSRGGLAKTEDLVSETMPLGHHPERPIVQFALADALFFEEWIARREISKEALVCEGDFAEAAL